MLYTLELVRDGGIVQETLRSKSILEIQDRINRDDWDQVVVTNADGDVILDCERKGDSNAS